MQLNDYIVEVNNLSKKFSKSLRRSMLYGAQEAMLAFIGKPGISDRLRRSEFWALDDVNLKLSRGQALGVIGQNGSGKTTLLSLLAGIYPPDKGSIKIQGRVAALIGLGAGFESKLTGLENIYLKGTLLGMSTDEIKHKLDEIIAFSELEDFISMPISNYSSGMRVRLGFSIATASDPDLILLDEVLAVGDRNFRAKCFRKVDSMASNACLLLVSHNMNLISRVCTDIMVLEKGKVLYYGGSVSEGIEFYNNHYKLDEASEFGTDEIKIRKIFWGDNADIADDVVRLNYRDELTLNMEVCLPAKITDPRFRLIIFNNNFIPIAESVAEIPLTDLDSQEKRCPRIQVTLPAVELVSGGYTITIVIEDTTTNTFLKRFHAIKAFEVSGDTFSSSNIRLQAKWEIK
jgi:lipopolysaccharide transport system ATP-binding protein